MMRAWTVPSAYSAADPWPAALLIPNRVEQRATTEASWTMMGDLKVVEMFRDLTLFDARITLAADRSEIYICRADEPKLRLSPGCCIRDWKVQTCLRTKTFKTSVLLGPASLASLVAVNVVSIQIGKPWLTRPKNGRHVDGTWTHTWNLIVDILATVAAACSDHVLRSAAGDGLKVIAHIARCG